MERQKSLLNNVNYVSLGASEAVSICGYVNNSNVVGCMKVTMI